MKKEKEYDYFQYVIGTELYECKNYFEKVNLRYAKSILDYGTAKHLKFHLYLHYFLSLNFIFFIWSNFDYGIELMFNDYISFIQEWFGNIISFIVMISILPGGLTFAVLLWCIIRSLAPDKKVF